MIKKLDNKFCEISFSCVCVCAVYFGISRISVIEGS